MSTLSIYTAAILSLILTTAIQPRPGRPHLLGQKPHRNHRQRDSGSSSRPRQDPRRDQPARRHIHRSRDQGTHESMQKVVPDTTDVRNQPVDVEHPGNYRIHLAQNGQRPPGKLAPPHQEVRAPLLPPMQRDRGRRTHHLQMPRRREKESEKAVDPGSHRMGPPRPTELVNQGGRRR